VQLAVDDVGGVLGVSDGRSMCDELQKAYGSVVTLQVKPIQTLPLFYRTIEEACS
jgi:hypothetical protein